MSEEKVFFKEKRMKQSSKYTRRQQMIFLLFDSCFYPNPKHVHCFYSGISMGLQAATSCS
jgi:hypothetical protein